MVFLVVLAGRPSFTNASLPVRGVADPVVALQMARDAGDVEAVLGEAPSADREVMRVKQYVDFGLIAGYLGLGVVIGAALGRGRGWLLAGLTIVAALLDVRENLRTLRVLNLGLGQMNTVMFDALRHTSVAKWVVLAVAITVLASVTSARKQWYLRTAAGLGLAGAGAAVGGGGGVEGGVEGAGNGSEVD